MHKIRNATLGVSVAIVSLFGFAGVAGATPPTPSEQITTLATDGFGEVTLIALAVAAGAATLAAIWFGIRMVTRTIRNGGRV